MVSTGSSERLWNHPGRSLAASDTVGLLSGLCQLLSQFRVGAGRAERCRERRGRVKEGVPSCEEGSRGQLTTSGFLSKKALRTHPQSA